MPLTKDQTLAVAFAQAQPMAIAIQGNMIGRAETAGPQGSGIDDSGACFTLTNTDVHAVAFA